MPYEITACPSCGSGNSQARPALVSQFISVYVLDRPPQTCSIRQCTACGTQFFSLRFTDDEIAKLYGTYRGEAYFRTRHKYEFWYTRAYNDHLGSAQEIAQRRTVMLNALRCHGDPDRIENALDYGGDRGQVLADGPGIQRYVYDLSGVDVVDGVTALKSEEEAGAREYGLVLLCHVLEHCSAPADMLRNMKQLLAPGGFLFLEVPSEYLALGDIPEGAWYMRYLNALCKSSLLTSLVDFYSSAIRLKFGRIPPLGFAKLNEHLNLFGARGLEKALTAAGFEVLECRIAPETGQLMALARAAA